MDRTDWSHFARKSLSLLHKNSQTQKALDFQQHAAHHGAMSINSVHWKSQRIISVNSKLKA